MDDDFEDAFFESDSDLSGEEEVDDDMLAPAMAEQLLVKPNPVPVDVNYRGDWTGSPAPGADGFNDFAAAVMLKAKVASAPLRATFDMSAACPPPQPHQEATTFLLHPLSPISRLLVDHPTGSGKTREMIDVLDNYFHDPRPKVPIFPKEPVCRNFYLELLRWPSRYRDFFCCLGPKELVSRAAHGEGWRPRRGHLWDMSVFTDEELRVLIKEMREVLEMKSWFRMGCMRISKRDEFMAKYPGDPLPAAPLRALRYTSAGGAHSFIKSNGLPASALFKIGFDKKDPNVYSGKVVIMDEVHNLVRAQTQYHEQLGRLRTLLTSGKGMVLAGFTGTPILSEPQEGRQLLDIIKGSGKVQSDEGFISSFPMRPPPLFPTSFPRGVPDAVLVPNLRRQLVRRVELSGETLQKYDEKRAKDMPDRRLRAYCSLCVHFGSLHSGKNGSRTRVLENFEECAPKLNAILRDVTSHRTKALVLVDRRSGMDVLVERLKEVGAKSTPEFRVATMENISAFNSAQNLRGEKYMVLVADAATCSEGVSFFGVRRVFLSEVPTTPSALVQSVGRAIRMYGHRGLPIEEQTVTTALYTATFPKWLRSPLSQWAYRAQKKHTNPHDAAKRARALIRTVKRVGIKDLDEFISRMHSYCPTAPRDSGNGAIDSAAAESKFAPQVAVGFLESIGLWTEAKLVREAAARPKKSGKKASRRKEQPRATGDMPKPPKLHFFVKALQALHSMSDAADAVARLHLSTLTADEEALVLLTARSREFVPALAELREKAIDRNILLSLVKSSDRGCGDAVDSDGESSAHEFAMDASSGDEGKPKEAPLVLPQGWRTELTGGKRTFVDPSGAVFRTEAKAKQAVDAERRTANVASRLRSKFDAKFSGSAAAGAAAPTAAAAAMRSLSGVAVPKVASAQRAAALAQSLCSAATKPKTATASRVSVVPTAASLGNDVSIAARGVTLQSGSAAGTSVSKREAEEVQTSVPLPLTKRAKVQVGEAL